MRSKPLYDVRQIKDLKDLLESSCKLYADKPAFLVKHAPGTQYKPVTYKELYNDVNALGTAFLDLGLKNRSIALIGENRYEWAVTYLAAVNGSCIIVPLDKELPPHEIKNLVTRAKADAIVFSGKNLSVIQSLAGQIDFIKYFICMDDNFDNENFISYCNLIEKGRKLVEEGDTRFADTEINIDEMSILLFTSGTTDISKGVMLSHRNIAANIMSMCTMVYVDSKDVFLSVLPIHHAYECTCGFLCALYLGSTIAFCEGLRHIQKNLIESKASIMLGVPLIFEAMYNRIWDQASKNPKTLRKLKIGLKISNLLKKINIDISKKLFKPIHDNFGGHIRFFISGAAGIDPVVAKGFRDFGIGFVQGYGLTECAPIVALNRDVQYKDDAAGLPLPGTEVKIVDKDSEGIGEIVVKGPNVMLGYYENPEATEEAFKDGWFHTGDLGYIDKDGFVHITGRKKSVIVTKNGKNVFPEEIETLLNKHKYIKESLVYGKNDESSGDIVISAIIVPDMDKINELYPGNSYNMEEIKDYIRQYVKEINKSLVTYKHIKNVEFRYEEFEKTTTRKIKRYVVNK